MFACIIISKCRTCRRGPSNCLLTSTQLSPSWRTCLTNSLLSSPNPKSCRSKKSNIKSKSSRMNHFLPTSKIPQLASLLDGAERRIGSTCNSWSWRKTSSTVRIWEGPAKSSCTCPRQCRGCEPLANARVTIRRCRRPPTPAMSAKLWPI